MYLVAPLVALGLFGCRDFGFESRDPWRAEAEERCLAEKVVQVSAYVEPESAIDGRGACGMMHPFKVAAMANGYVMVEPRATLACPLIGEVDRWLAEAVQPAAAAWFGEQVVEIKQLSAYSCRTVNNQPGGNISEHAFGNALDVGAFKLASGREVTVEHGWKGAYEERGFLRQVHAAACERFSTVLGPGADVFHYNHFHLDLARRASGRSVCRPAAEELPPPLYRDRQGIPMARRTPQAAPMVAARAPQRPADLPLSANMAPASRTPAPVVPRDPRPVGEPLNLSPPMPRAANAPMGPSVIERQPYPAQPAPQPYPAYAPSPNRPVPPAAVPQAKIGADPTVTGSIDKRRYFKETPILKSGLPDATPGED
ncbi:MAG TPA: extensin family protein [Xanthobacteraceae bacterium]|nr:extensin family protein [Xanthobacteraceae bacterium]